MLIYKLNVTNSETAFKFGVSAFHNGTLVKQFCSISDNETDMKKLVAICNELNLELCHLDYVIEDYLTDFCI